MADTWFRTVEEVFHGALERTGRDRDAFLRERCARDTRLLREVLTLLDADEGEPARVLEDASPAGLASELAEAAAQEPAAPGRIGPYRVLQPLGEGGFADVYLAEQERPVRRRVALKVIKPGMDSRVVLARFEAERQALALMDHPGVAKVFDAGTTDAGRPYFVMEYVPGDPILAHCDRHRLDLRGRLELFILVCEAIQHAHQKGIIHRDLKPSNILVTVRDGRAVPMVIDFGVAKAIHQPLTDRTVFTEHGQLIGTPEYMSPEQAELTGQDIDTRTDIYSLGVLLYELLTGVLPFDRSALRSSAFAEIQRLIREVEPPRPSTRVRPAPGAGEQDLAGAAHNRRCEPDALHRALRRDLDWITMRAMDKDRTRRYASASDLAADCRRYLADEPVLAGPPSALYRVRKFVRRNRLAVTAAGLVLAALVLGTIGTTVGLLRAGEMARVAAAEAVAARAAGEQAERSAERARSAERDALWRAYVANTGAALAALDAHEVITVERRLEAAPEEHRNWEWRYARAQMDGSTRTLRPGMGMLTSVAVDPQGRWIAAVGTAGTLVQWDARTGDEMVRLTLAEAPVWGMSLSRSAGTVAVGAGREVVLVDMGPCAERSRWEASAEPIIALAFSPGDESLLAVADDGGVSLWRADGPRRERRLVTQTALATLAFDDSGRTLVAGDAQSMVYAWDVASGRRLQTDRAGDKGVFAIAAAGEAGLIAAGCGSTGNIELWRLGEPRLVGVLTGHTYTMHDVAFAGERLLSASADRTIGLWDLASGRLTRMLRGHSGRVYDLVADSSGEVLHSAAWDGTVKAWDISGGEERASVLDQPAGVNGLAFSPDGARLSTTGRDGSVRLFAAPTGTLVADLRPGSEGAARVAFSSDGARLALSSGGGGMWLIDAGTGAVEREVRAETRGVARWHEVAVAGVAVDRAGRLIAGTGTEGEVELWDAATGERRAVVESGSRRVYALAFNPEGDALAAGDHAGRVLVIEPASGNLTRTLEAHERPVFAIVFTPDGRTLVTGAEDGSLAAWDAGDGTMRWRRSRHTAAIFDVAMSPDGTRVATAGGDRTVRVWDVRTGEDVATFAEHDAPVLGVAFSPDGECLASGAVDGRILLRSAVESGKRSAARRERAIADRRAPGLLEGMRRDHPEPAVLAAQIRADPTLTPVLRQACLDALLAGTARPEAAARAVVARLAESRILRDAVVAAVRAEPGLDEPTREAALEAARALEDTPERLVPAAWSIVWRVEAEADARAAALRAAQAAGGDDARSLRTLGAALLRTGDLGGAVSTLERAADRERLERGAPGPAALALLAIAQARSGRGEEARAALEEAGVWGVDARVADAPDLRSLLDEAARAVEGPPS